MTDLEQLLKDEAEERSARLALEKETLLIQLQALGVAFARGEYDGGGDEGAMGPVALYADLTDYEKLESGMGSGVSVIDNDDLANAVSDYLWEVTIDLYGDWYDGGLGAFGTATILVGEQKVVVEHGWRIEEIDTVWAEL